jgi:hypothetical protein
MGFMTMNLLHAQQSTSLDTIKEGLVSDLRSQQNKAMNGITSIAGSSESSGVYISSDKYVLFHGSVFNQADSTNYEVKMDENIRLIPSPQAQIIFAQQSGETSLAQTITIQNTSSQEQKILTINRYGVIESSN